jgi:hypothetical protein
MNATIINFADEKRGRRPPIWQHTNNHHVRASAHRGTREWREVARDVNAAAAKANRVLDDPVLHAQATENLRVACLKALGIKEARPQYLRCLLACAAEVLVAKCPYSHRGTGLDSDSGTLDAVLWALDKHLLLASRYHETIARQARRRR